MVRSPARPSGADQFGPRRRCLLRRIFESAPTTNHAQAPRPRRRPPSLLPVLMDTGIRCFMKPEVIHAEATVQPGVQDRDCAAVSRARCQRLEIDRLRREMRVKRSTATIAPHVLDQRPMNSPSPLTRCLRRRSRIAARSVGPRERRRRSLRLTAQARDRTTAHDVRPVHATRA